MNVPKILARSVSALALLTLLGCVNKQTSPPAEPAAAKPVQQGAVTQTQANPNPAWEGKTFKVCADPNNPPYSDKQGQGFENKIAELFAKELGKPLDYYWFPQRMGFIRNTLKAQLIDSADYRCDVIMGYPTGAEMAATTKAYYRSTYAIVLAKKRGFDDIKTQQDLANLPKNRKAKLKIAMFDASPVTNWLMSNGLIEHAIPYQTMTGDAAENTAQRLEKDFRAGKLDAALIWGPIAGWIQVHSKPGTIAVIPMHSEPGMKLDFPISMAVRIPDKDRKAILEQLIGAKSAEIRQILTEFKIPLVDDKGEPLQP